MNVATQQVLRSLELSQKSSSTYFTSDENEGGEQVFGGQIIAQSLRAASLAQKGSKQITSLQLSFLRRADVRSPLTFRVELTRDGSSFTRSQVFSVQDDALCTMATVTFHEGSSGLEHQTAMPDVPAPTECEDLVAVEKLYRKYYPADLPGVETKLPAQAVDIRFVNPDSLLRPGSDVTNQIVWVRFSQELQSDPELHKAILGYMSDQSIAHVVLQSHALGAFNPGLRLLSLDHAISFHRSFKADDWLLLVRRCDSLTQGLASVSGSFYSADGDLVASIYQNAYVRVRE